MSKNIVGAAAVVGGGITGMQAALDLAQAKAVVEPKDMAQAIFDSFSPREPDFRILGPTKPREGSAGLVIRHGHIVAEWGDVERVDMTFSAVKSYLSTMMALAMREDLVSDLHERLDRVTAHERIEALDIAHVYRPHGLGISIG